VINQNYMTKYFQKAQAIEKEIAKYCHYGAELVMGSDPSKLLIL
jgi:hypothetical protein